MIVAAAAVERDGQRECGLVRVKGKMALSFRSVLHNERIVHAEAPWWHTVEGLKHREEPLPTAASEPVENPGERPHRDVRRRYGVMAGCRPAPSRLRVSVRRDHNVTTLRL
eukprot:CAMPEP_0185782988 /NCGR_PEP_ID=MMETSP1174-20130828/113324_1 /TAXON_ID=35687 /ORGANISM="Dictyocha speculum, Strain CCMP1381" /LENGTH=110 /DNA_ID=CAMNT_0028473763 /DNA_START=277 /DNA_END=605 /DNA_ORIENTATION=-